MANSISIGSAYKDQAIVGGLIDDTPIGNTTKSSGKFTTLNATGATTLDGNVAVGNASTDLIGFYGATAVDQPATIASVTTTAATSTTNAFGYTTSTQADAIVTALNAVIAAQIELGLLAAA